MRSTCEDEEYVRHLEETVEARIAECVTPINVYDFTCDLIFDE